VVDGERTEAPDTARNVQRSEKPLPIPVAGISHGDPCGGGERDD